MDLQYIKNNIIYLHSRLCVKKKKKATYIHVHRIISNVYLYIAHHTLNTPLYLSNYGRYAFYLNTGCFCALNNDIVLSMSFCLRQRFPWKHLYILFVHLTIYYQGMHQIFFSADVCAHGL